MEIFVRILQWLRGQRGGDPSVAATLNEEAPEAPSSLRRPLLPGLTGTFSSLANPNFRMLWFGMLFSIAAMQMNIVARSWLAYNISGSALVLGLVAIARGLPHLILSPIAGVAADRFAKRKLLILSQFALCVFALANAVLVHLGIIQVWHLVVIGLFQGAVFPFSMPVRQAYIPELVKGDELTNALALDSSGGNLNRVLLPSLAGVLIAWEPTVAFYAVALFYLGGALTLLRLPIATPHATKRESVLNEMMAGFRYITGYRQLRVLIAMGFLAVILGIPFQQLLPVFQVDVLGVGPVQLGLMYTAVGVGALSGSLVVAYRSKTLRKERFQVIAGIAFGVMLIPFALSSVYWVSLILLGIIGFASQSYLTLNRLLVLLRTDSKMYGRVMGVYMISWSLMPVATLPMGALVDAVGAPLTVSVAGALLTASIISLVVVSRPDR